MNGRLLMNIGWLHVLLFMVYRILQYAFVPDVVDWILVWHMCLLWLSAVALAAASNRALDWWQTQKKLRKSGVWL